MTDNTDGIPLGPEDALQAVMSSGLLDGLAESTSRRDFGSLGLGALLATLGGAVLGARPAEAKPSDVKGSPNIPLRVFSNMNGKFILWADGSITNPKVSTDPRISPPYPAAPGYPAPQPVSGRTQGSPNVAVDIIQDENGTYVLFADGSIRKPSNNGASAPPYANVKFYAFAKIAGGPETNSVGLTRTGGGVYTFDRPFLEIPMVFGVRTAGVDSIFLMTGHPQLIVTKNGYTNTLHSESHNWGGLVLGKIP